MSLHLISFAHKQVRMDTFKYKLKISLKAEILSRCSGNLNNGLDIVNAGRMVNYTCATIVFKFYSEENKMMVTELQVILDDIFNPFVKDISEKNQKIKRNPSHHKKYRHNPS